MDDSVHELSYGIILGEFLNETAKTFSHFIQLSTGVSRIPRLLHHKFLLNLQHV